MQGNRNFHAQLTVSRNPGRGAGGVPRIIAVTHGTDGDVMPFVRLGSELRRGGHEVTLITHAPYRAAAAGLDFTAIDTAEQYARHQADTAQLMDTRGGLGWLAFYERNGLFEQLAFEVKAIAERHDPGRTVLVGRHTSALSVRFAAELLGCPVAWVAVSPIQVMGARLAAHMYATELAEGFQSVRDDLGLPPISDWYGWFAGATMDIGLWPRWFDQAGAKSPARFELAGFAVPDAASRGAFSPEVVADRPILISGGTGRMLNEAFYPSALKAVGGLPAVVVTPYPELLPDPLPEGVRWFDRLPFDQVVPKVRAVVHHGGIGTLTRALMAGTPQLVLADGADRPDNAARLAKLGLAKWLPPGKWPEAGEHLRELLTSGEQPAAPEDLDPSAGITRTAALVASLLGPPRPSRPVLTESQREALRRHLKRGSR